MDNGHPTVTEHKSLILLDIIKQDFLGEFNERSSENCEFYRKETGTLFLGFAPIRYLHVILLNHGRT
jgi:hypothetical protein